MSVENGICFPSRERFTRAAIVTAVVTLPIAGFVARREMSLRKTRQAEIDLADKSRLDAINASEESANSGDSGFVFPREI
jgi:hypothetical protein